MKNFILFGPPGCGKGTQSAKLVTKYNFKHLATGDLLRKEIAEKTSLGIEAKKLMDNGILVPDHIVVGMIATALNENKNVSGFLFDGFPRTVPQAKALDKLLQEHNTKIAMVVSLQVNENELINRMMLRSKTSGRTDDASKEVQQKRQIIYKNETLPVSQYYKTKLTNIDGEGTIDAIFSQLCQAIDSVQ